MLIDTTCNLLNANMIFKDLETVHILSPEKIRSFPLDDYSWNSIKACYELYCTEIHTRIEQLKERSRVHMKDFADILPSREEFWRILIDKGILLEAKEFILIHKGEMQRCYKFLPKFVIDCLQSLTLNREKLCFKEYIFLYAEQKETIIAQTSILVPIETFKKTVGYSFILSILQKEKIISPCSVASLSLDIQIDVSSIILSKFDHIERKSFMEIGVTKETSCKIFNQLVKLQIISEDGKLLTQELGRVWLSPLSKYTTDVRNILAKYFKYRLCLLYFLREKDIPLDLLSNTHELLFRDLVDANIITSVKTQSDTPKTNEKEKLDIIYDLKNKKNQFPRILKSELMNLCVKNDFTAEELKQKLIREGLCKECEQNTEGCLEIIVKYETLAETSEEQKLNNLGNEVRCFILNRLKNSLNLPNIVKQLERWKVGLYKFENADTELKALAECLTEEDQIVLYKDILTMTNNGFGEIFVLVERKWTQKSVFKMFCILAIGFIQVGIAMAFEFYSVGSGTFIASSLLSEGIGDIMFAVECLISGHCTIHSYLSHKTLSLTISALTGGVASMVTRGAKCSRFGYKTGRQFLQRHSRLMKAGVSKTFLAKTTAKRIANQIINVTSMRIIDKGIDCYLGNILRRSLVELVDIRQNIIVSPDKYQTLKEKIVSLARKLGRQDAKVLVEKMMDKCLLFRESDSSVVLYKFDTIAYAFSKGLRDGMEKLEYTEYSRDYWLYHIATICNLLAGGIEVKNAYDAIQSFQMSILDYFEHEIQTAISLRHNFDEEQEGALEETWALEEAWASELLHNVVKIANTEINKYFEMQIESIIIKPMFQIIGSKMSKMVYKRVCQLYHYGKNHCQSRTIDNLKKEVESDRKQISPQMEDNIKNEYSKKLIKLLKETENPSLFADIIEEGIPVGIHAVQAVAEITEVNIVIETIGADLFTMTHKVTPYGNYRGEEVKTIQLKYHFNTETGTSHFTTVNTSESQLHSSKCLLEAAMNLTGKTIDRKFLSEKIRTHPDICRNIKRGLHDFFNFQSDISYVPKKNPEPSEIIEKGHLLSKYKHQRDDKIVTELRNRSMSVTLENKQMIWKELKINSLGEEFEIQKQIKNVESFFGSLSQNPKLSHASENRTGLFNASLHVNKIAETCVETSLNYVNPTEVYFGNKHEYVDNLQIFYNCRFNTRFALSNHRGMIWGHPNALHSKYDMHSTGDFCYSHQPLVFDSHHKGVLIGGKRNFLKHQPKVWEDKGNHLFIMLNGIKEHVEKLPTKTQLQQIDLSNWCSGLGYDLASHNEKELFLNGIEQEKYKLCVVAEHLINSNKKAYKLFSYKTRHEKCQMKQFEQDFSNLQKTLSINESIKKIVKDTVNNANSLIIVGNIMKTPVSDLMPKEQTEPGHGEECGKHNDGMRYNDVTFL